VLTTDMDVSLDMVLLATGDILDMEDLDIMDMDMLVLDTIMVRSDI